MNRRVFVAGATLSLAGSALAGTSLRMERGERAGWERIGSAVPDGPGGALGRRQLVWSVPTSKPMVALTFDDGPDPQFTPRILAVLDRYRVRATFNVMGYNAIRHGDLLRAVVAGGHELGNHTWTHQDLAFQSTAATRRQLHGGLVAIQRVAGVRPRWFRPPRGELTGAAVLTAAELGQDILLWSVTRGLAGVGTPTGVAAHIVGVVGPGDVLALHDGIGRGIFDTDGALARGLRARRAVEVAALPAAIEGVLGRGLRLVTASELLEVAGGGVSDDGHHLGACGRTAACSSAAHLGEARVWG